MDVPLPLTDSIHRTRLGREWLSVVVRQGHPLTREPLTLPRYLAQQHVERNYSFSATSCAEIYCKIDI